MLAQTLVGAIMPQDLALSMLGYPDAALADAEQALKEAREVGHAATLMYALFHVSWTCTLCGEYQTAKAQLRELVPLADKKGSLLWKAEGMLLTKARARWMAWRRKIRTLVRVLAR
jgi:hypothetical protein